MKNIVIKRLFIAVLLTIAATPAFSQVEKFKALYVFNFAKNIGWSGSDVNKDFVISVMGDEQLADELIKHSRTRTVGGRRVVVKIVNNVADATGSEMIYVSEKKTAAVASMVGSNSRSVIICGRRGQCSSGAHISFYLDEGRLCYEISEQNIHKAGYNCSKKMLELGRQV